MVTPRLPAEVGPVAWVWTGEPLVLPAAEVEQILDLVERPRGPTPALRKLMSKDWREP